MAARIIVYLGPWPSRWSDLLTGFCAQHDLQLEVPNGTEAVHAVVNRSLPSCLVLDGADDIEVALSLCAELKKDHFTAIVPVVVLIPDSENELTADCLAAGSQSFPRAFKPSRADRLEMAVCEIGVPRAAIARLIERKLSPSRTRTMISFHGTPAFIEAPP